MEAIRKRVFEHVKRTARKGIIKASEVKYITVYFCASMEGKEHSYRQFVRVPEGTKIRETADTVVLQLPWNDMGISISKVLLRSECDRRLKNKNASWLPKVSDVEFVHE